MSDELDFESTIKNIVSKDEMQNVLTPAQFEEQITHKFNLNFMSTVAGDLSVSDENSARQALSMSLQAKKLRQQLDESRKEIVKPHFDYQKAINKIVKDVENKLEKIEENLKDKINDWNEKRKELPFENMIDLEMKVDDGLLFTQKKWDFNIDDSSAIPAEYMVVDERKIKEAIASGVRNIPGVQIFERHELITRIKN